MTEEYWPYNLSWDDYIAEIRAVRLLLLRPAGVGEKRSLEFRLGVLLRAATELGLEEVARLQDQSEVAPELAAGLRKHVLSLRDRRHKRRNRRKQKR